MSQDTREGGAIAVANAPVSYGAFEITVGHDPNVPDGVQVLDHVAGAGYALSALDVRSHILRVPATTMAYRQPRGAANVPGASSSASTPITSWRSTSSRWTPSG